MSHVRIKLPGQEKPFEVKVQQTKPWNWGPGSRSHKGQYEVMTLLSRRRSFWLGLIKYPKGSFQPAHQDTLVDRKHYKVNFVLKRDKKNFKIKKTIFSWGRLSVFRPDLHEHEVTPVETSRLVLSLSLFLRK